VRGWGRTPKGREKGKRAPAGKKEGRRTKRGRTTKETNWGERHVKGLEGTRLRRSAEEISEGGPLE